LLLLEPKLLHRLPLVQLLLDMWSILRAFCTAKFALALAAAFASTGALVGRASTAGRLLLMLSLLLAKLLPTLQLLLFRLLLLLAMLLLPLLALQMKITLLLLLLLQLAELLFRCWPSFSCCWQGCSYCWSGNCCLLG
jgi:hypothetical protein